MDIVLARTFLEIVTCGNFVRAAERPHVPQTAVSVRVQTLEELLGPKLFVRNKAGASLTPAGEQLRSGRLGLVRGAPEFLYPVYAVYSEGADPKIVGPALAGLRHVGAKQEPIKTSGTRSARSFPRRSGRA